MSAGPVKKDMARWSGLLLLRMHVSGLLFLERRMELQARRMECVRQCFVKPAS